MRVVNNGPGKPAADPRTRNQLQEATSNRAITNLNQRLWERFYAQVSTDARGQNTEQEESREHTHQQTGSKNIVNNCALDNSGPVVFNPTLANFGGQARYGERQES